MVRTQRGRFGPHVTLKALGGAAAMRVGHAIAGPASNEPDHAAASPMDVADLGGRVLVIAPHPDDEAIAAGGAISQALAAGARVRVVVITAGDGYRRAAARIAKGPVTAETFLRLGRLRHAESEAALDALGVPEEDRLHLGYPDGSLGALWDGNWDPDRPHSGADGGASSRYDFAEFPSSSCCGSGLASDLKRIVTDFGPTAVIHPDASDAHHDHWATAAFVDYALEELAYEGGRYSYLTHFGHYPFPWLFLPDAYLQPPTSLLAVGGRWHSLPLTERAERLKLRAVEMYGTQLNIPDLKMYLLAFVRRNELYRTHEPARPSASCPDVGPPAETAADRVVVEPRFARVSAIGGRRGAVSAVRMVQGQDVLWIGASTAGASPADRLYEFHLRLFGGGAPARLDVAVTGETVQVLSPASNSVVPSHVSSMRSGGTLWIGVPSGVLDRRESAMVAIGTRRGPRSGRKGRTAWRTVRLSV